MLQSLTPDLRHLTISYNPQRRIVSQDKIKERFAELMNRHRNREVQGNDEEENSGNDPFASDEDGADDDDQDTATDKRRRARMDTLSPAVAQHREDWDGRGPVEEDGRLTKACGERGGLACARGTVLNRRRPGSRRNWRLRFSPSMGRIEKEKVHQGISVISQGCYFHEGQDTNSPVWHGSLGELPVNRREVRHTICGRSGANRLDQKVRQKVGRSSGEDYVSLTQHGEWKKRSTREVK